MASWPRVLGRPCAVHYSLDQLIRGVFVPRDVPTLQQSVQVRDAVCTAVSILNATLVMYEGVVSWTDGARCVGARVDGRQRRQYNLLVFARVVDDDEQVSLVTRSRRNQEGPSSAHDCYTTRESTRSTCCCSWMRCAASSASSRLHPNALKISHSMIGVEESPGYCHSGQCSCV